MSMRVELMLPEALLFGGGLALLLGGSFLPLRRLWWTRLAAGVSLVASGVVAAVELAGPVEGAFEGAFAVDTLTGVVRVVVCVGTLMVVALGVDELRGSPREAETYALLLFSATGTMVLGGAHDLLVLVVGFLLASIPLYGLIGMVRTPRGAEAAMKTYLMGALFGIVLMAGVTLFYGLVGETSYPALGDRLGGAPPGVAAVAVLAVLVGLLFKAGGVPAHFWVPDAAQGASATVAAFLTTVPKIGAVAAAYRLVDTLPADPRWPALVAVLAVLGMTLGNLAAYWQQDPRRLLGWSTVGQVGFLLVPVAVAGRSDLALPAMLVYLAGYTVTNIAAFGVTAALPERQDLDSYRGLASARPWLAAALLVSLLGLVGTPPTAVFVGKLTTATAAWDAGLAWLTVVVFVNTLVSLFYYLRWVAPAYRPADPATRTNTTSSIAHRYAAAVAVTGASLSLALGLAAGLLWSVFDGALFR